MCYTMYKLSYVVAYLQYVHMYHLIVGIRMENSVKFLMSQYKYVRSYLAFVMLQ